MIIADNPSMDPAILDIDSSVGATAIQNVEADTTAAGLNLNLHKSVLNDLVSKTADLEISTVSSSMVAEEEKVESAIKDETTVAGPIEDPATTEPNIVSPNGATALAENKVTDVNLNSTTSLSTAIQTKETGTATEADKLNAIDSNDLVTKTTDLEIFTVIPSMESAAEENKVDSTSTEDATIAHPSKDPVNIVSLSDATENQAPDVDVKNLTTAPSQTNNDLPLNTTLTPTAAPKPPIPNTNSLKSNVKEIMTALTPPTPYLLIGGSSRTTNDIDLLIQRSSVLQLELLKTAVLTANTAEAKANSKKTYIEQIDLLTEIVGRFDFGAIAHLSVGSEVEGVKVAPLDVLLGTKILAHHSRPDGQEGEKKRASDLSDANWICYQLHRTGGRVRKEVSDMLDCGAYNMLLLVAALYQEYGRESVEVFEEVGGREFECEWGKEEFEGQIEYYEVEIEDSGYEEDEVALLRSRRIT